MNGRGSLDEQESGGTAPIILVWELSSSFWFWLPSTNYVDLYYLADSSLAIFGALLAQSMRGIPTMFMVRLV